jgi:hypothetical protein
MVIDQWSNLLRQFAAMIGAVQQCCGQVAEEACVQRGIAGTDAAHGPFVYIENGSGSTMPAQQAHTFQKEIKLSGWIDHMFWPFDHGGPDADAMAVIYTILGGAPLPKMSIASIRNRWHLRPARDRRAKRSVPGKNRGKFSSQHIGSVLLPW